MKTRTYRYDENRKPDWQAICNKYDPDYASIAGLDAVAAEIIIATDPSMSGRWWTVKRAMIHADKKQAKIIKIEYRKIAGVAWTPYEDDSDAADAEIE
jgi:hypothetical protein